MPRPFLLGFLVLLIVGSARAEVVPELYHGEAIITGQDNLDERARGVRRVVVQPTQAVQSLRAVPPPPPVLTGHVSSLLPY